MTTLCVIPARGGSKRIPRKNIKLFCGKPIIAYSIEAALASNIFDEVMVSTDDLAIADIAKKYGASVPFMRSAETANDFAITIDVLFEVLIQYKDLGKEFDFLCCLYPCAPFVNVEVLGSGFELLQNDDVSSVMPVCKFPVPIEWAIDISDNQIKFKDIMVTTVRSQDLTPYYYDVGIFYYVKVDKMLSEKSLYVAKSMPLVIDENMVQDIDTIDDWKFAETKYKILNGYA